MLDTGNTQNKDNVKMFLLRRLSILLMVAKLLLPTIVSHFVSA